MINSKQTISIIIPSHNRSFSLKRLLDKLGRQTYSPELMQVIVVADGCKDNTVTMLKEYNPGYVLNFVELEGRGAAIARNKGVELATNPLLLFLDDDIDPSEDLVKAHVDLHETGNRVVIGYLPFAITRASSFYQLILRSWWEEKFQQMRMPGYRFNYEDLISGNFSIPHQLFKKLNGFDTGLRCREDYELGMRLIKSNAEFIFSQEAWGYHRDQVTNLKRSLERKKQEGKADIQFWKAHPEMVSPAQDSYSKNQYTFLNSNYILLIDKIPEFTDAMAFLARHLMNLFELLRFRNKWNYLNNKLHSYWYGSGVLKELHTRKNLKDYLRFQPENRINHECLTINLKNGLAAAEKILDENRPATIKIILDNHQIGSIAYKPGFERLRGVHLRPILATELESALMKTVAFDKLTNSTPPSKKKIQNHSVIDSTNMNALNS
jgi:glycosyltransferase involved in cell wall biosynthesis